MATQDDTPLVRAHRAVRLSNECNGAGPTVRIGILTPLSPTGAMVAGEMMVRGACLAAAYVRETGGVQGRQIELCLADDQATAGHEPMARSAVGEMAKLLCMDKVVAVLGNWMVRTTEAVVDLSHRLGVPHFVTSGHPHITRQRYDTVFRTFYTIDERAHAMMDFVAERGGRRIGIVASTSPFGQFYADALAERADGMGIAVMRHDFDPDRVTDFRDPLQRMKDGQVDHLFNLGIIARESCYNILLQAAELGIAGIPILVGIPFPSAAQDYWKKVGSHGACVVWPSTSFQPKAGHIQEMGQWLIREHDRQYGGFPSEMTLTAFTDACIVAQALRHAQAMTPRALWSELQRHSFETWRGKVRFEHGATHWNHCPDAVQLMQYQHPGQQLQDAAIVFPPHRRTAAFVPGTHP